MTNKPSKDDQKREEAIIKRMLNTPPKPRQKPEKDKPKKEKPRK